MTYNIENFYIVVTLYELFNGQLLNQYKTHWYGTYNAHWLCGTQQCTLVVHTIAVQ